MNYHLDRPGWIEVICGPMFAGKTEELIRRVNRMNFAKKKYLIFKPTIDDRFSEQSVISRNGYKQNAININSIDDIKNYDADVYVIDEFQFFLCTQSNVCQIFARIHNTSWRFWDI